MRFLLLVGALAVLAPQAGRAEEKKDKPMPADVPVTAKLVAKKTTYGLDLGGKTGEEFRKMLKEAEKAGRVPPAPAVDMALELTNTSDKEIKLWTGGDPVQVDLKLAGPGAVNATPLLAFTTDFRGPVVTALAPGKSLSVPITKLQYGFRGASNLSYWTEPGEYKLTASYKTAIQPAPKGSTEQMGFGLVSITAEPITIKVEAAK
jgi:hypothetical protein